ncbi:MAG: hypothetical protein Q7V63_00860 [Gammaproteobacteria bacterium]|nr:hypothetical protein [Gammaproteobacteria bacterium]
MKTKKPNNKTVMNKAPHDMTVSKDTYQGQVNKAGHSYFDSLGEKETKVAIHHEHHVAKHYGLRGNGAR